MVIISLWFSKYFNISVSTHGNIISRIGTPFYLKYYFMIINWLKWYFEQNCVCFLEMLCTLKLRSPTSEIHTDDTCKALSPQCSTSNISKFFKLAIPSGRSDIQLSLSLNLDFNWPIYNNICNIIYVTSDHLVIWKSCP